MKIYQLRFKGLFKNVKDGDKLIFYRWLTMRTVESNILGQCYEYIGSQGKIDALPENHTIREEL